MKSQGKEVCKKCNGHKVHAISSIALLVVCDHCGGKGEVDWIDNMTGNPSPNPPVDGFKDRIAIQNVQMLITEIKRIFFEVGTNVTVTVEQNLNGHSHVHSQVASYVSVANGQIGNHTHQICNNQVCNERKVLISI